MPYLMCKRSKYDATNVAQPGLENSRDAMIVLSIFSMLAWPLFHYSERYFELNIFRYTIYWWYLGWLAKLLSVMIFSKKGSTLEAALENYVSHSLPIRSQMMKSVYTFSAVLTQCTLLIDMVLFSITTPWVFAKIRKRTSYIFTK